jgi:hypothetical protein
VDLSQYKFNNLKKEVHMERRELIRGERLCWRCGGKGTYIDKRARPQPEEVRKKISETRTMRFAAKRAAAEAKKKDEKSPTTESSPSS